MPRSLMGVRNPELLVRFRHVDRWRRFCVAGMAFAIFVSLLLDLQAGPAALGLAEIIAGILDPSSLTPRHQVILWWVRMPDALIAVAVGAALGLAGLESQTVLNNPLASPFTLGVSSAAVLGASVSVVLVPSIGWIPDGMVLPALALLFALASSVAILAVVQRTSGARETVVLYGIALVFLCNALTASLHYVADAEAVQRIVFWTIGNLTRAGWPEVATVFCVFLLILPFSLRDMWVLTVLRGGEAHARSSGVDVARLRLRAILRVSVLAAFAVCFVGAIGFIGLVAPHVARIAVGEDHRFLLPASAICGALLLSVASFLSKALIPGVIIPVGILTAVVGVPALLVLLWTRKQV